MKIKLFIFFGLLYIIILGAFVFNLNMQNYTLSLGSLSYTLPVVIWVLLPVCVLFVAAILHMSFYGLLRYLKYKNFFADGRKFENYARDLLLQKAPNVSFKTKEFKNAALLSASLLNHHKIPEFDDFNQALDALSELKEGKNVNLKKFRLQNDNPLSLLNEKNHLKNDLKYAFARVKNQKELEDELDALAFDEVIKHGSLEQIRALRAPKQDEQVLELIKRFEQGSLELELSDFESLLKERSLNQTQFLNIAKMSIKKLAPEAIINIFKKLKDENAAAQRAYCFILAELSMYDDLRLEIGKDKNFTDFQIVLLARENKLKLDLFSFIQ